MMMNSSSFEDSLPQVSALALQTSYQDRASSQGRFITKQDSDNLPISDERYSKNNDESNTSRTHIHDFKVRKHPLERLQPDEEP